MNVLGLKSEELKGDGSYYNIIYYYNFWIFWRPSGYIQQVWGK